MTKFIAITEEGTTQDQANDLAKRLQEAGFFDALVVVGDQIRSAFEHIGKAVVDALAEINVKREQERQRLTRAPVETFYPPRVGTTFARSIYAEWLDDFMRLTRQIRKDVLSYCASLELTCVSRREWSKRDALPPTRIWEPGFQLRGKHTARFGVRGYSHARAWKRRRHS